MVEFYVLRGNQPVLVEDVETWARWVQSADLTLVLSTAAPGIRVRTSFIPVRVRVRVLYEPFLTEVEGIHYPVVGYSTTLEKAIDKHKQLVARVRSEHTKEST